MKIVLPCLLVAVACVAGAAEKDKPSKTQPATPQDVQAVFEALDRNDDQRISKDEAARERSLSRRFASVDSSGDGYLSRSEYRARPRDEPFE
jgi:hypothetical protein